MTIRVKPLKWDDGYNCYYAETICGVLQVYRQYHVERKWAFRCGDRVLSRGTYGTEDEVKAAAFQWYEQRILGQVEEVQ